MLSLTKNFFKTSKPTTMSRGKYSSRKVVTSSVPQGSVLTPVAFLVYVDAVKYNIGDELYLNIFADDAKVEKNHNRKFMFRASK